MVVVIKVTGVIQVETVIMVVSVPLFQITSLSGRLKMVMEI